MMLEKQPEAGFVRWLATFFTVQGSYWRISGRRVIGSDSYFTKKAHLAVV